MISLDSNMIPIPNLAPPNAANLPCNCKIKVRNNVSTGAINALGNPILDFDQTEVQGWAIRESDPRLLVTIGASVEEIPLKIWIQDPKCLPANFAAFNNIYCEVTFAGIKQIGVLRPIHLGHPFIPANFQFIVGAFKGTIT